MIWRRALGEAALNSVLGQKGVVKHHGKIILRNGQNYFVTFHPSAAKRFPTVNAKMRKDFEKSGELMKIKNKKTRSV